MQKNNCCVVFYKGKQPFYQVKHAVSDFLIRKFTKGKYSHCEIAVQIKNSDSYLCFSSSFRDGGVRSKIIKLKPGHWDIVEVDVDEDKLYKFFDSTIGMKYDLLGCLGIVSDKIKHKKNKYFCSEWCSKLLGYENPEKVTPNGLYDILNRTKK